MRSDKKCKLQGQKERSPAFFILQKRVENKNVQRVFIIFIKNAKRF